MTLGVFARPCRFVRPMNIAWHCDQVAAILILILDGSSLCDHRSMSVYELANLERILEMSQVASGLWHLYPFAVDLGVRRKYLSWTLPHRLLKLAIARQGFLPP